MLKCINSAWFSTDRMPFMSPNQQQQWDDEIFYEKALNCKYGKSVTGHFLL